MPYSNIANYHSTKVVVGGPYPLNYVFKATKLPEKTNWFVALRHGLYSAQKDVAVANIFKYYMPSSPSVHIVYDAKKNDYYAASEEVKKLVSNPDYHHATFSDFGKISVLSYFIGESDIHSGNYLIQQLAPKSYHAVKIDNAEALDDEVLSMPVTLDDILANHWNFDSRITSSDDYKNEQIEMIHQIAKTPFSFFEKVIKNTVTSSQFEEANHFMNKVIKSNLLSQEDIIEIQKGLNELDPSTLPNVDQILDLLEVRHERFQEISHQILIEQTQEPLIHYNLNGCTDMGSTVSELWI